MKRSQNSPTEAQTLKAICDYLDPLMAQGKLVYVRHSPSSVVGSKGKIGFRKPRASQLGAPDILIFVNGTTMLDRIKHLAAIAVEVKSPTGIQSQDQLKWQHRFESLIGRYWIVRNIDQFISLMEGR